MSMSDKEVDLTQKNISDLKSNMIESYVDNLSTKDLVRYVMDDLDRYYEKMPNLEFLDEAENYWEDYFDEIIQEVKDYE
tara:strand:- start:202 stop:438 length:237 start_codon:yes stop_codon:yes gene_type:complete